LSTSLQSLFVILKCSESLFSAIYSNRYCSAALACLRQYVLTLISMDRCRDSLYGQQSAPASRHVLDRPFQPIVPWSVHTLQNNEVSIHRASPAHHLHWLAIDRARKKTIDILCCSTSNLFMTMNDMAGEQFYEKNIGLVLVLSLGLELVTVLVLWWI